MIITILIVFLILTIVSVKNNPIKKVKNIFDVYDNSSTYNLLGIVIAGIIGFIIYLFQKQ
jgi:preprotein translocase subunit Sss1